MGLPQVTRIMPLVILSLGYHTSVVPSKADIQFILNTTSTLSGKIPFKLRILFLGVRVETLNKHKFSPILKVNSPTEDSNNNKKTAINNELGLLSSFSKNGFHNQLASVPGNKRDVSMRVATTSA